MQNNNDEKYGIICALKVILYLKIIVFKLNFCFTKMSIRKKFSVIYALFNQKNSFI